jgi:hypothetical protein
MSASGMGRAANPGFIMFVCVTCCREEAALGLVAARIEAEVECDRAERDEATAAAETWAWPCSGASGTTGSNGGRPFVGFRGALLDLAIPGGNSGGGDLGAAVLRRAVVQQRHGGGGLAMSSGGDSLERDELEGGADGGSLEGDERGSCVFFFY